MINKELSKKILTIGPDYTPPKGGIEMVLMSYSQLIPDFQFISSWRSTSKFKVVIHFLKQIPRIIYTLLRKKDIEIVHLHGSFKGSVYRKLILLYLVKSLFKKKVIYHSHGSNFEVHFNKASRFNKYLIRQLIERSDVIICLSHSWKIFFESNFNCKSVRVLNNIINIPGIKYNQHKNSDIIKYLFLGLIGERKGIYDLMNLIIRDRAIFDFKIEIHIGGNGEVDKIEEIIKDNNLDSIVKFHGWVSGEKKSELLNMSDVFILPSYNEGLPIAILEAMSYNLPIISTNVGGIPEIIENGVNGFLINPGNLDQLKRAILHFMNNKQDISSFGSISGLKSQSYFPDKVISDLEKIYNELLMNN